MDGQDFDSNPDIAPEVRNLLVQSIATNTNAYATTNEEGKIEYVGKATECALLGMVSDMGFDYKSIRTQFLSLIIHDFNSARKRMSTIIKVDNHHRVCAKGAPELLIKKCTQYLKSDGTLLELDNEVRDQYINRIDQLADDQLRTMMMTYADLSGEQLHPNWEIDTNVEKDLILIGICGIRDPLRDEVPKAIEDCKKSRCHGQNGNR